MSKTLKALSDEELEKATGGDDDGYIDFNINTGEELYNGYTTGFPCSAITTPEKCEKYSHCYWVLVSANPFWGGKKSERCADKQ